MQNSYTLRAIENWLPRMDSHHQHPVSETGVLLVELQGMAFVAGLAPVNHGLERPAARLLGAHEQLEVVPGVGIAPTSPRFQRGANLSQLLGVLTHHLVRGRQIESGSPSRSSKSEGWSFRAVTLRGLPLIGRALCS